MQNSQTVTVNNDWHSYRLGEICEIKTGKKDVNAEKADGIYPFFTCAQVIHKINSFTFDTEAVLVAGNGFFNVKYYNGKFDVYQRTYVLHNFRQDVNGKFIYHFVNSKLNEITKNNRGSTIRYIRLGDLTEQEILLPDLAEQNRIVSKIETLLQNTDTAITDIGLSRKQIKRFRQSVLSAAVTGKLTQEWRDKNRDCKSADEILIQIKEQRLTTGIKKNKLQDIYTYEEQGDKDELPDRWSFVSLDKLCDSFNYGTSTKSQTQGKVPVLRMGNLQRGEIDWNNLVFTSDDKEIEKYLLRPGDVLFNRTNSPELVGKTSIYRGEPPAVYAGYLIKINNTPELNSEYLNYSLNSGYAKDYCYQVKSDGVSQSNINAQKLGKFEVPFCSIEEQQEIVKRVKSMFEVADLIEKQIETAGKRTDKLTQSILAKAFRGEL